MDPAYGRQLATAGMVSIACCVVLIVTAHVLDPLHGPIHHMISDYALGPAAPLFDAAVVLLAAGSAAILLALVRGGVLQIRAPATALLAGWCASMVIIVLFPPCDCATQPTVSGAVHGSASLVGFLVLPLAARRAAATWAPHRRWRARARVVRWCASASLVAMAPLGMAVVDLIPEVHGWVELPLGLIQRGLVVTELMLLLLLGCWARGAATRATSAREGMRIPCSALWTDDERGSPHVSGGVVDQHVEPSGCRAERVGGGLDRSSR